jgi:cbb3-type cytochrome oxidase subunit 3
MVPLNWQTVVIGLVILAGTGFIFASERLTEEAGGDVMPASAQRLRAIGLIVLGLGIMLGVVFFLF